MYSIKTDCIGKSWWWWSWWHDEKRCDDDDVGSMSCDGVGDTTITTTTSYLYLLIYVGKEAG